MAAAANKARRDQDALKALRDYAADRARVDANTLRLRALRLQKEAADERAAAELAAAYYGSIFRRVVPVSSPAAAEMTKLLENIYRCVNIALVNELKQLCMRMGIDIHEVIDAAKTKPFGFQAF